MIKTIAWNVDTQYDFMRPDGKLYVHGAETIEPALKYLTDFFRDNAVQIVNTADWHTRDSAELSATPDFVRTFPEHCMQHTRGAAYVPASAPHNRHIVDWQDKTLDKKAVAMAREIVLYKDAFDVFSGNQHTDAVLDIIQPDRVIVYGVATNVCVNFAVQGLLNRGKEVVVVKDAIKELPNLPLEEILGKWTSQGVLFTTTSAVEEYVR